MSTVSSTVCSFHPHLLFHPFDNNKQAISSSAPHSYFSSVCFKHLPNFYQVSSLLYISPLSPNSHINPSFPHPSHSLSSHFIQNERHCKRNEKPDSITYLHIFLVRQSVRPLCGWHCQVGVDHNINSMYLVQIVASCSQPTLVELPLNGYPLYPLFVRLLIHLYANTALYVLISYSMTIQIVTPEALLSFVCIIILSSLTGESVGFLVSTLAFDYEFSLSTGTLVALGMMLLGGFYVRNIPFWLQWLKCKRFCSLIFPSTFLHFCCVQL